MKLIFGFPGLLSISNASHLCQVQISAVEVHGEHLDRVIFHLKANVRQCELLADFTTYSIKIPTTKEEYNSEQCGNEEKQTSEKINILTVDNITTGLLQTSLLGMPQMSLSNVTDYQDLYHVISLRFELAKQEASMDWTVLATPAMLAA